MSLIVSITLIIIGFKWMAYQPIDRMYRYMWEQGWVMDVRMRWLGYIERACYLMMVVALISFVFKTSYGHDDIMMISLTYVSGGVGVTLTALRADLIYHMLNQFERVPVKWIDGTINAWWITGPLDVAFGVIIYIFGG